MTEEESKTPSEKISEESSETPKEKTRSTISRRISK